MHPIGPILRCNNDGCFLDNSLGWHFRLLRNWQVDLRQRFLSNRNNDMDGIADRLCRQWIRLWV